MTDAAYDPWAEASQEAASSNRNTPVPAGTYDFTVWEYEVIDYAKDPQSRYAGEKALKLQLRIEDGQPQANRRLFPKIGLFPRYLPTDKNPQGSVNEDLFTFFEKAMGWSLEQIKALAIAVKAGDGQTIANLLRPIAGAPLSGKVRVVKDTRATAGPDDKDNEVRNFDKPKGGAVATAGTGVAAAGADIWNTGAPAAPAAQPAAAQPAAAGGDIWGQTPAAPSPQLAAAAASTAGY